MKTVVAVLSFLLTISLTNALPCSFAEKCDCKFQTADSVEATCSNVDTFPTFNKTNLNITQLTVEGNFTKIPEKAFYELDTDIGVLFFQRSARVLNLNIDVGDHAFMTGPDGSIDTIKFFDFDDLLYLPDDLGEAYGLTSVTLHRCGIVTLINGTFNGTNLMDLTISNSRLRIIEDGAFDGIEDSLRYLQLDGNNLDSVPLAIKRLNKVTRILLDSNNITEIEDNSFPVSVDTIDLSNNQLSMCSEMALGGIDSLVDLRLNNCNLDTVPIKLYNEAFKSLTRFELGDNKISNITEDSFPQKLFENMTIMPRLDNNPIELIEQRAFIAFQNVTAVSFTNFYELKDLDFATFMEMSALNSVSITNCRKLENITVTDAHDFPKDLFSVKITGSNVISDISSAFDTWLAVSMDKKLSLPDNGFRCNPELMWMSKYEFCYLHPRINLVNSNCNQKDVPVKTYLFKQFDHNCS